MPWSNSSNASLRLSRFYENCESASEDFLYRGCPQKQKPRQTRASNTQKRTESLFTGMRRSFLCCFGDRHGSGISLPMSEFGMDTHGMFGSARSQASSVQSADNSTYVRDRSKIIWAISPPKSHKGGRLTPGAAKWIVLSWASKVVNGGMVNRRMLDAIVVDALSGKNALNSMSSAEIKGFPGLQLAENTLSFDTTDHVIAIDSIIEALNESATSNKITFVILVRKEGSCYAVYFNRRGGTKDIVLLTVNIMGKRDYVRVVAFNKLEDMREYMMDLDARKSLSSIYYYMFNITSPHHDLGNDRIEQKQIPTTSKTNIPDKRLELESDDSRKDAKIVFSHAKLIAKNMT